MSNKIVSGTYRAVIDDVIANVRQDFEEMGIEKEVLEELQRSWEARLVATGVTDFEGAAVPPRAPRRPAGNNGAGAGEDKKTGDDVKPKLEDHAGEGPSSGDQAATATSAAAGSSSAAGGSGSSKARRTEGGHDATHARSNGHDGVDGSGGEDGPAGSQKAGEKRKQPESNSDEIGSDLDDSDDEENAAGEGGGEALDGDTVLCLYDKVNRVRNRWKCILRDGVANIDGRDYLFSRCNTEFEW
ncbi:hypothetical protein BCV69DRAFT_79493 [Microstroma glucosiphilum]|uniref:Transcription initiation factor IIA large subunit n=1 Tax=Pseudomicrostroma glucosiphilum TaxID=1684307 RepID=A0A316U020_9BASI|nr:hypothetical protein BCV69DRAFT_79493 [Pseudomicrostroma glucosiphilum]PWN18244.1 hypothetical protein BCV69DRAFT_79493 [Pseudomicrostroma glucosiphilum]